MLKDIKLKIFENKFGLYWIKVYLCGVFIKYLLKQTNKSFEP